MKNEKFDAAQAFVLKWEGGLSDDKNDAGGITKYGVCLRFLKTIRPNATADTIRNLTKQEATDIFHSEFWDRCRCDELPDRIAFALYDTAVNTGCKQAVKFLQRALKITDDGRIGTGTIRAAKTCDVDFVLTDFLEQRRQFYRNLAAKKPSQQVFLRGWLNRTNALAVALSVAVPSAVAADDTKEPAPSENTEVA